MKMLAGMKKNAAFFALYFCFWMAENCLSPYLGIYYDYRGLSGGEIGAAGTIFSLAAVIAALLVGLAGDRLNSPRHVVVALTVGLLFSTMLLFAAKSRAIIFASVFFYGFCYSPTNGIVDKALMDQLGNQPEQFSSYRLGGTLGAATGVLAAGVLLTDKSFLPVFLCYWLWVVLCGICALRLPRQSAANSRPPSPKDYLSVIRHRAFLPIYGVLAVWGLTESSMLQFLALHVSASGYPSKLTSIFIALAMAGECAMFAAVSRLQRQMTARFILILAFTLQCFRITSLALLSLLPLPLVMFFQLTGGGAYAALYSTITQEISLQFPSEISCSAHTMKLVAIRGIGSTCGFTLLGFFFDKGYSSWGYGLLAAVAGSMILLIRKFRLKD